MSHPIVPPAQKIEFPRTDAVLRTLDNGLEFIVKEDHSAPVVSVQAWVRTGSCLEDDFLGCGISHLLEHMVFKGTGTRGPAEHARLVQSIGGYLNAYTSFDRTVYYIDAPVEGVETVFDVLTDLVARAAFPEDEFEKEKDVIRREIDMGEDDPDTKNSHLLFETVFRVHPMGQPIIGHLDLFNTVTREQMVGYYRRHYAPNNMFFVVAGPVTADQVDAMLTARVGDVPRAVLKPTLVPAEPEQLGRREAHVEFPTELSKLTLSWRVPGLTHPDVPALEVLGDILGHGRSSRLYRRLRDEMGLAHAIGASCYTPPTGGIFSVYSELEFDKRDTVRAEVLAMIEDIRERGVTAAEVAKAQKMVLGEQLESLTSMRGLAGDLGSNWHAARNLDFTRDVVEAIERVTPEAVQDVARRYLIDRQLTVTSLNPKGSLTRAAAAERRRLTGDVEKTVLPNGLTLLVKPDHRAPLVTLHAALRGGQLAEAPAQAGLSRLMARCILKGTASRTAEDISTALEEAGGGITAESGGGSLTVTVDVLKPDLGMGLDILSDVLLRATFPDAEVAREKEVQLAGIRVDNDRLTTVAFREVKRTLFGTNPFAWDRNGTPETVAALDAAAVRDFHASLAVTGNLVLAVYGDVDPATVRGLVEQHFAGMKEGLRVDTPVGVGFDPAFTAPTVRDVVKEKKQAVLAIGYPTIPLTHPDRAALDLLDEACSDMASRLFLRIREEHGLAYYTGAFQLMGMAPGAFAFYLGTSPEHLEKAQAELVDEIRRLGTEGLEDDELERVKKSWLGKHLIHQQSPAQLARLAALDELYGLGHDHHVRLADRVRAMTPGDIRTAARRYFHERPHVVARVHP